ncbi:MAG TPA: CBS domain-containing protein [Labilithrix sp.]|nr:CBS domain-containing protein [Labilithrix sp.]
MTPPHVKHPILRLDVVEADGTRVTDHVVFCRLQNQSVRVEECCRCVHCDAIQDGEVPTVDCVIPVPPHDDPAGERTEVGSLLLHGTVVVAQSVSLGEALAVMREGKHRSVAIVDDDHVMVGLVHDASIEGHSRRLHEGAVTTAMASVISIDERTPVRVALRLLAANHLREATVVSKHGVPIGVFRDVDGLHWIANARR